MTKEQELLLDLMDGYKRIEVRKHNDVAWKEAFYSLDSDRYILGGLHTYSMRELITHFDIRELVVEELYKEVYVVNYSDNNRLMMGVKFVTTSKEAAEKCVKEKNAEPNAICHYWVTNQTLVYKDGDFK